MGNNYNNRSYNNGGGNYQNRSYNNQNGYNNGGNNRSQGKKHSGAKTKKYTPTSGVNAGHEMQHTHGWKYRRRGGLVTVSCNTTSKSVLSDKGWYGSVACTVKHVDTGQKAFYWGTMERSTGKVIISDLGWVVNPKGGKGGYTGSFSNN